ncbi:L-asparaginase II [Aspergillus recurvatus]
MGVLPTNCVFSERGGILENKHDIHAAVVDTNGALLYSVGNPSRVTLARSTAKPAQALAILETGALDQFGFDDADIALMCASHNSENAQVLRATRMLCKVQAQEQDLQCGGHASLSETVNAGWIRAGLVPTAIHNNCSGKHAGMIGGAKALTTRGDGYHLPEHPMQVRVQRVFSELSGLDARDIKWGIDGCNLPAPALPLLNLARVYCCLAASADEAEVPGAAPESRTQHLSCIFRAMVQHPELVAGQGRFCTALMKAYRGAVMGKLGADGCYGVSVRASEQTNALGAGGAIGIAVKVEDGNIGILYSAVVEILQQLGIGTTAIWETLEEYHRPKLVNTAGVVTGSLQFGFRVQRAP